MWELTIRTFGSVRYPGDWEINVIGRVWNLRIGRSQVALWRNYTALFDWHRRLPGGPFRPGDAIG